MPDLNSSSLKWKIALFTVLLVTTSRANFAFWQQRSKCPTGYIKVPKNTDYVTEDFCVMQYEAKAEINAGGAFDADGLGVNISDHKPASLAANQPWQTIRRTQATSECASLGAFYSLISNAQWQTIARNVELVPSNWTGGSVGSGCLFQGNNGQSTCGYNSAIDPIESSVNSRGILNLSNGLKIYDFAGNLNELLIDNNNTTYGSNAYFSVVNDASHPDLGTLDDGVSRRAKAQFGPSGTYSTANNNSGLGYGRLSDSNTTISRGGDFDDTVFSGPFFMRSDSSAASTPTNTGFRCVYAL